MGLPKLKTKISVEDYLAGEKTSPVKHEYIEGEVYALAGASDNHSRIVINMTTNLSVHPRDTKCERFSNDIKIHFTKNIDRHNIYIAAARRTAIELQIVPIKTIRQSNFNR